MEGIGDSVTQTRHIYGTLARDTIEAKGRFRHQQLGAGPRGACVVWSELAVESLERRREWQLI